MLVICEGYTLHIGADVPYCVIACNSPLRQCLLFPQDQYPISVKVYIITDIDREKALPDFKHAEHVTHYAFCLAWETALWLHSFTNSDTMIDLHL